MDEELDNKYVDFKLGDMISYFARISDDASAPIVSRYSESVLSNIQPGIARSE